MILYCMWLDVIVVLNLLMSTNLKKFRVNDFILYVADWMSLLKIITTTNPLLLCCDFEIFAIKQ